MNKQELLDAIRSKFTTLESVEDLKQPGTAWYLAHYFDVQNGYGHKGHVSFYVENEGKSNEEAYWDKREPKPALPPTPPPTFQQRLQEHLSALKAAGTIQGGTIQSLDAVNETATVHVWLESGADIIEKRFFIDKDSGDNWRRREIVIA